MADDSEPQFRMSDREVLLILRRDVKYIRKDIDEVLSKVAASAPIKIAEEHEKRIRVLENFRWWLLGGAALAAFAGEFMARLIGH
jgi:hypothetical protein